MFGVGSFTISPQMARDYCRTLTDEQLRAELGSLVSTLRRAASAEWSRRVRERVAARMARPA